MPLLLEDIVQSPNIEKITELFEEIKQKKNVQGNLNKIAHYLKAEFNIDVTIEIANEEGSKYFYGAKIYPSREELEGLMLRVLENPNGGYRFEKITGVVIVIDGRAVFGQKDFVEFTARELTAIILHEIGHKVFSERAYRDASKVITSRWIGNSVFWATIASNGLAKAFLVLLFAKLITDLLRRRWLNHNEVKADSLAVKYGYGPEIHSTIEKIDKYFYGDKDSNRLVEWARDSFSQFGIRKREIIAELERELKNASSEYERQLIEDQLKILKR